MRNVTQERGHLERYYFGNHLLESANWTHGADWKLPQERAQRKRVGQTLIWQRSSSGRRDGPVLNAAPRLLRMKLIEGKWMLVLSQIVLCFVNLILFYYKSCLYLHSSLSAYRNTPQIQIQQKFGCSLCLQSMSHSNHCLSLGFHLFSDWILRCFILCLSLICP